MTLLAQAFATGYECLSANADLFDRINVFPVADGDTGTNLRISLAPLRDVKCPGVSTADLLSLSATGNSGNIAAAFFREFAAAVDPEQLPLRAAEGRNSAWQAVASPRSGTMLSVFDTLASLLAVGPPGGSWRMSREPLRATILDGVRMIPEVARAGVVDAGALAMFVFFDGFFQRLGGESQISVVIDELFAGRLQVASSFCAEVSNQHCVDAVLAAGARSAEAKLVLAEFGESVVLLPTADRLKIHVHTSEPQELRKRLNVLGKVIDWSNEPMGQNRSPAHVGSGGGQVMHIVSDAAGSLPRDLALHYGISLLDSYVVADGQALPESLCDSASIYARLRANHRVTTAQASMFERHLHYARICREHEHALYLCVGSAFTGNYETASAWQRDHDAGKRFEVVDTGAASGRLGLIVLLTARFAEQADSPAAVTEFARQRMDDCEEYVFIDKLKYLVTGGRVSRAGGFFGDLLHLKPVISPTSTGVRKRGVVGSRDGQLEFALERLSGRLVNNDRPTVLLQYSDNEKWLRNVVIPAVTAIVPAGEVIVVPLSLTSGVHMGPGTWAMAFAP